VTRRGVLLGAVLLAGCRAFGPAALDAPPGHRVVLGRVELDGFDAADGLLHMVKADGSFAESVLVTDARRDFAVSLPPGEYRISEVRAAKDRHSVPDVHVFPLRLVFQVGPEPATYIGTLRLDRRQGRDVRVQVRDEYEDTLRVLRRLYSDLPPSAVKRLTQPAPA
jgi:hypothetical protein